MNNTSSSTYKPYWEKLKDPRWQKRRLEIMQAADFECHHCHAKDKTLNVHHCYYEKGKDPWDYEDDMLVCLCETCHEETESVSKLLAYMVSRGRDGNWKYALDALVQEVFRPDLEEEQKTQIRQAVTHALRNHHLWERERDREQWFASERTEFKVFWAHRGISRTRTRSNSDLLNQPCAEPEKCWHCRNKLGIVIKEVA